MTNLVPATQSDSKKLAAVGEERQYVTMRIAGQDLGINVLSVEDIIRPRKITTVALAPPEVAGVLNLRGRIVTAIDLRVLMGLPPQEDKHSCMSIVTMYNDELYSFLVDEVGDVLTLPVNKFEKCPSNLEKRWRDMATGVYSLENKLMVVLNVERLLTFE